MKMEKQPYRMIGKPKSVVMMMTPKFQVNLITLSLQPLVLMLLASVLLL